jgi:excisionase family DNA binding protein
MVKQNVVYKTKDLAKILNVSRSTIYRYLKDKKIKYFKVNGEYRIFKTELDEFIQKNLKRFQINKARKFISIIELKDNYSYYKINKMVKNKQLRKVNKRYYENLHFNYMEREPYTIDEDHFYDVDVYIPNGIICQLSAAVFYGLTTHWPCTVDVAVKRNQKVYNLPDTFSMTPVYYSDTRYRLGIREINSKNGSYRIYDLEKTVCDFVFYRNRNDPFTYQEIMKNYVQHKDKNFSRLYEYAEQLHVDKIIELYMEILT